MGRFSCTSSRLYFKVYGIEPHFAYVVFSRAFQLGVMAGQEALGSP